jgi:ubiquinone biosynthesis protein Coq4
MLARIRILFHMLKFAKDPTNTVEVFRFTDALVASATPKERRTYDEIFLEDPSSRALYEASKADYLHKPFDLKELAQCAPGTLGHAYAAMMLAAGLDPEFFEYTPVKDVTDFYTVRLRKTHDIYHVLTGFGTDVPSELGLQGFYLAQLHTPVPLAILVSGLLYIINRRDRAEIRRTIERVVAGYQMGLHAKTLHGVAWELHWHDDLDAVRRRYGIASWTQTAAA